MLTWKSASILCRARRGDTSAMLRLASCRLLLLLLQPITAQYYVMCGPITDQYCNLMTNHSLIFSTHLLLLSPEPRLRSEEERSPAGDTLAASFHPAGDTLASAFSCTSPACC